MGSPKRSGMVHVNEGSQFYLPLTCISTSGMSNACLYSITARFSSRWRLEAELAWVAGYIWSWFAHTMTVTHPSPNQVHCTVTLLITPLPLCQTAIRGCEQFAKGYYLTVQQLRSNSLWSCESNALTTRLLSHPYMVTYGNIINRCSHTMNNFYFWFQEWCFKQ